MFTSLLEAEEDSSAKRKTWQVCCFEKKKRLRVRVEGVQRGFPSERKGNTIPCRGAENRNGAGTNSGESGARSLEAESIRSRA